MNIPVIEMALSEKRPLFGELDAATGQLTLTATATWTLYKADVAVAGAAGNCDGQDLQPRNPARAWKNFRPSDFGLAVGTYRMVFTMAFRAGDNQPRVREPFLILRVTSDG